MKLALAIVAVVTLASCSPISVDPVRGLIPCPSPWVSCAGECWPPDTNCDSVGMCALDTTCRACPGLDVPWCVEGRLECCPEATPFLCGGACVETTACTFERGAPPMDCVQ